MLRGSFADFEAGPAVAGRLECARCGRLPLVGESVGLYERRGRGQWLCQQCAVLSDAPVRRERMRSEAGGLTVRRAA